VRRRQGMRFVRHHCSFCLSAYGPPARPAWRIIPSWIHERRSDCGNGRRKTQINEVRFPIVLSKGRVWKRCQARVEIRQTSHRDLRRPNCSGSGRVKNSGPSEAFRLRLRHSRQSKAAAEYVQCRCIGYGREPTLAKGCKVQSPRPYILLKNIRCWSPIAQDRASLIRLVQKIVEQTVSTLKHPPRSAIPCLRLC
jgi:hypothetical protein